MSEADTFRTAQDRSGLSQRDVGRILGVHPGTVNRWCADGRPDKVAAPSYAWAFLEVFGLLTEAQRRRFMTDRRGARHG